MIKINLRMTLKPPKLVGSTTSLNEKDIPDEDIMQICIREVLYCWQFLVPFQYEF